MSKQVQVKGKAAQGTSVRESKISALESNRKSSSTQQYCTDCQDDEGQSATFFLPSSFSSSIHHNRRVLAQRIHL